MPPSCAPGFELVEQGGGFGCLPIRSAKGAAARASHQSVDSTLPNYLERTSGGLTTDFPHLVAHAATMRSVPPRKEAIMPFTGGIGNPGSTIRNYRPAPGFPRRPSSPGLPGGVPGGLPRPPVGGGGFSFTPTDGGPTGQFPLPGGGGSPGGLPGLGNAACDFIQNAQLRAACKAGASFLPGFPGGGSPGGQTGPTTDPTPGTTTPAERSVGITGLSLPMRVESSRLQCPTFANGKRGILWYAPISDEIVCLPRGTSGAGFGLVRLHKPRKKPPISAAQWKAMRAKTSKSVKKFSRELAKATGTSR